MIEQINFKNLQPYDGNAWQSFEMLCFVIAKRKFPGGNFTPINGKGGDGGVEFYLTKPNGDIIIWQCKFFERLDSPQKAQISKSYEVADKNHGSEMVEWVICSPIDFTPAGDAWFKDFCKGKKPIKAWGESVIVSFLNEYPDICNFFFNTKLFTKEWFEEHARFTLSHELVKAKYIPEAHQSTEEQDFLTFALYGERLAEKINSVLSELLWDRWYTGFEGELERLSNKSVDSDDNAEVQNLLLSYNREVGKVGNAIKEIVEALKNNDWHSYKSKVEPIRDISRSLNKSESELCGRYLKELHKGLFYISRMNEVVDKMVRLAEIYTYNDIHITGDASSGKSHISIDTFANYTDGTGRRPSIMVISRVLNSSMSAEAAIVESLGLTSGTTFDEVLESLNVASEVSGYKALILIDGLNELFGGLNMWKRGLCTIIQKVSKYPNILLVLTYRVSYIDAMGLKGYLSRDNNGRKLIEVDGFDWCEIDKVIDGYFSHFDISVKGVIPQWLKTMFAQKPIMLRLFCETHRGNKNVPVCNLTLIEIFDNYIDRINNKLIEDLEKDPYLEGDFLNEKLGLVAEVFWKTSAQFISAKRFRQLGDIKEMAAIDKESILVRDLDGQEEVLSFTFDVLGGYLIAKYLISRVRTIEELTALCNSREFMERLIINHDFSHPLRDVITGNLERLSFLKFGVQLLDSNVFSHCRMLPVIFESPMSLIQDKSEAVTDYIRCALKTTPGVLNGVPVENLTVSGHPANVDNLSIILRDLPADQRDLTWSECLRVNRRMLQFVESQGINGLIILALATTNLGLRRNIVNRLYNFARTSPKEYLGIIIRYITCNDDYVQEGILASMYGAVLSTQDFEDSLTIPCAGALESIILGDGGINLDNFLIRNYVRLILKLAERKGLILADEINVRLKGQSEEDARKSIGAWELAEHEEHPMYHDFSNYTLGAIIPNGSAYKNPPLKQRARWFIMQQIKQMGWNKEAFAICDREIEDSNYRPRVDFDDKIERYGKKYSWIGYYRLAKVLEDAGLLDCSWGSCRWRIPEVMFDPTFPSLGANIQLELPKLLGDLSTPNEDWIKTPFDINLTDGVLSRSFDDSEFVCIWGQYSEKDTGVRRNYKIFVKAMIVDSDRASDLSECLTISFDDFEYREPYQILRTFGAEFDCWNEASPSGEEDIDIRIGEKKTKVVIDENNWTEYVGRFENIGDEIEEISYNCKGFRIFNPVLIDLNEYNSQNGEYYYLAKSLKDDLKLKHNPNSPNLLDGTEGREALKVIQYLPNDVEGTCIFVYLRKDLLSQWLAKNNKRLVWLIWGEKETWDESADSRWPIHNYEYFSIGVQL